MFQEEKVDAVRRLRRRKPGSRPPEAVSNSVGNGGPGDITRNAMGSSDVMLMML